MTTANSSIPNGTLNETATAAAAAALGYTILSISDVFPYTPIFSSKSPLGLPPPFHLALSSDQPHLGRLLISSIPLEPGDLVLSEEAVMCASYEDDICLECNNLPNSSANSNPAHSSSSCLEVQSLYPESIRASIDELENQLAEVAGIDDLDKARLFIKCCKAFIEQAEEYENQLIKSEEAANSKLGFKSKKKKNDKKKFSASYRHPPLTVDSPLSHLPPFIRPIIFLTFTHLARAEKAISTLHILPLVQKTRLLSPHVSDALYARILSTLNTNCHELLPPVSGCGLFPLAAMLQHDCLPNCNFTTDDSRLSIYATTSIPPYTPLSIEYASVMSYQPTHKRQEVLWDSHAFVCKCQLCEGKMEDRCRPFRCPSNLNGKKCSGTIYPRGRQVLIEHPMSKSTSSIKSSIEENKEIDSSTERMIDFEGADPMPILPNSPFPFTCSLCNNTLSPSERHLYLSFELVLETWMNDYIGEEKEEEEFEEDLISQSAAMTIEENDTTNVESNSRKKKADRRTTLLKSIQPYLAASPELIAFVEALPEPLLFESTAMEALTFLESLTSLLPSRRPFTLAKEPPQPKPSLLSTLSPLLPHHYLYFYTYDRILRIIASQPQYVLVARDIASLLVTYLSLVRPDTLTEESIYNLDMLAQTQIVCGDVKSASETYARASHISSFVCGKESNETKKLKELALNTPRSREELAAVYKRDNHQLFEEYDEQEEDYDSSSCNEEEME